MLKVKREKKIGTKGNYVNNPDILAEIIASREIGRMTDKLGTMVVQICEGYSRKPCFSGYSFREDMVSEAVINLCKNWSRFDEVNYSNPFAYYTQAVHRTFIQRINLEKEQRDIRDKLRIDLGIQGSFDYEERSKEKNA